MIEIEISNSHDSEIVWLSDFSDLTNSEEIFKYNYERLLDFDANLNDGYSKYSIAKWFPERKELVLKRDIFGSIPLFFCWGCNKKIYVSDSLTDFQNKVFFDINICRILTYLENDDNFLKELGHQTFFENIYQVPPGCAVIIDNDSVVVRYSEYRYLELKKGNLLNSLTKVLDERLPRNEKVAVHVSGGIDSTGIACVLESKNPMSTNFMYCGTDCGFDSTSEYKYQNAFEVRYGKKIELFSSESCLIELTKKYVSVACQPPLLFNTIALFEETLNALESRGVLTLVTGFGGDQVLDHGFDYIKTLISKRKIQEIRSIVGFLTVKEILSNNYKNWAALSFKEKYNLTLQHFVFPIRGIYSGNLKLIDFINSGGNFFFFIKSSVRAVVNKVLKVNPLRSNWVIKKDIARFNVEFPKHDIHHKVRNMATSNMNETFLNLERIFGVKIIRPYLDSRIYAASIAYTLEERFGMGVGRKHFRTELNSILPDVIRNRILKTSFNEYFVSEISNFLQQVGEIPSDHQIWEFLRKKEFRKHKEIITNKDIFYLDKVVSAHYLHKVLNIKLWLDFVLSLKK